MTRIERPRLSVETKIPKLELAPVTKELADTARDLLWTLPGGWGGSSKLIPDQKDWEVDRGKSRPPEPDIKIIGGNEYQATWRYGEANNKYSDKEAHLMIARGKGIYSHRILFQSGNRILALAYGHDGKDIEKVGASITYIDKHERHIDSKAAVEKALTFIGELMGQAPDSRVFLLPQTKHLLSHKAQAA